MPESDEEKKGSKFNISVGGNVSGDMNVSDRDIQVNKTVNVDKSKGDEIHVGSISGSTGVAIGPGAQAHVTQNDLAGFAAMIEALGRLDSVDAQTVADAQEEVREIQEKVEAGKAEESWLARKFRALALMGEDILDVATKTAINPALGMFEIVRKVARKAREEAGLPAVD